MVSEDTFLRAIRDSPADGWPIMIVYADWLEERGGSGPAEAIRLMASAHAPAEPLSETEMGIIVLRGQPCERVRLSVAAVFTGSAQWTPIAVLRLDTRQWLPGTREGFKLDYVDSLALGFPEKGIGAISVKILEIAGTLEITGPDDSGPSMVSLPASRHYVIRQR